MIIRRFSHTNIDAKAERNQLIVNSNSLRENLYNLTLSFKQKIKEIDKLDSLITIKNSDLIKLELNIESRKKEISEYVKKATLDISRKKEEFIDISEKIKNEFLLLDNTKKNIEKEYSLLEDRKISLFNQNIKNEQDREKIENDIKKIDIDKEEIKKMQAFIYLKNTELDSREKLIIEEEGLIAKKYLDIEFQLNDIKKKQSVIVEKTCELDNKINKAIADNKLAQERNNEVSQKEILLIEKLKSLDDREKKCDDKENQLIGEKNKLNEIEYRIKLKAQKLKVEWSEVSSIDEI